MRARSPLVRLVGVAAFLVAVVGSLRFDWGFESSGNPLVFALGVVVAAVAVAVTFRRRS